MTADGLDDDEYTDVSLNSRINRKLRKLTFLNLGLLFLQIMMIILLVVVFVVSARYIREFEKSINVAEINKSMIKLGKLDVDQLNRGLDSLSALANNSLANMIKNELSTEIGLIGNQLGLQIRTDLQSQIGSAIGEINQKIDNFTLEAQQNMNQVMQMLREISVYVSLINGFPLFTPPIVSTPTIPTIPITPTIPVTPITSAPIPVTTMQVSTVTIPPILSSLPFTSPFYTK